MSYIIYCEINWAIIKRWHFLLEDFSCKMFENIILKQSLLISWIHREEKKSGFQINITINRISLELISNPFRKWHINQLDKSHILYFQFSRIIYWFLDGDGEMNVEIASQKLKFFTLHPPPPREFKAML